MVGAPGNFGPEGHPLKQMQGFGRAFRVWCLLCLKIKVQA